MLHKQHLSPLGATHLAQSPPGNNI